MMLREEEERENPSSPCILLHGQPLNTPAKIQYGLLPAVPSTAKPTKTPPPPSTHLPSTPDNKKRKNSFQRAVDVNKETLENTKRNAGYSAVDIVKEIVRVERPRPPSPSSKFAVGRPGTVDRARDKDNDPDEIEIKAAKIKFIQNHTVASIPAEPPFYDTLFPLKPAIRPPPRKIVTPKEQEKERVVVKRIIYADDQYSGDDEPVRLPQQPPNTPNTKPKKLGGARRIPR